MQRRKWRVFATPDKKKFYVVDQDSPFAPYDPNVAFDPTLTRSKNKKENFLMTEEKPKWRNDSTSSSVKPDKHKKIEELYRTSEVGQNFTERERPTVIYK